MRYGSVCSGIEAASVAWKPLGWSCAFVAEIDPGPSAVLSHRYPGVRNYGDFTTIGADAGPIGLLVGGTPCQGLSLAGWQLGLDDERSGLAVDFLRLAYRLRPRWLVWENVAGALSINEGRDFACFLGLLSGLDIPVPDGGWRSSGVIPGASTGHYGCAYRVLDARHFGCPMSRARVFAVAHLGDWRPAAAALIDRPSLSGHRGGAGEEPEDAAAGVVAGPGAKGRTVAITDRKRGGGRRLEWRVELAYSPLVRRAGGSRTARQIVDPDGNLRVLSPRETERIMGFPDDWTLVPFRDGMMGETRRNEMLGNTMAVPCMRWIGERIARVDELTRA